MGGRWIDWCCELPRKVFQKKRREKRDSAYREDKTAAHSTVKGDGLIARLRKRK